MLCNSLPRVSRRTSALMSRVQDAIAQHGGVPNSTEVPVLLSLYRARLALKSGDMQRAQQELGSLLASHLSPCPLPLLLKAELEVSSNSPYEALHTLAPLLSVAGSSDSR